MKKCIIIGGGIIGLSTAYYLQKEGHQVIIIDESDFLKGASHINGGILTPSHIIPLAAPGMITKGLKWMFSNKSPFHVTPRLDSDFIKWLWLFKKAATKRKVVKSIPIIKDINLLSKELYEEIKNNNEFDFYYQNKGLLMCYQTDKAAEEEWKIGKRAIKEGLQVENLTQEEVKRIEPNVTYNIKGAIYYHSDAHMEPHNYMKQLYLYLKAKGVIFVPNEKVIDVSITEEKITTVQTNKYIYKADEFILATGSWTSLLAKKLGLSIYIEAGKGYSFQIKRNTSITIPAILTEAKVAVTPMNNSTRFAGTMELGVIHNKINKARVRGITKAIHSYYPNIEITGVETNTVSHGFRPCSPDGLPYIGKSSKVKNVTIATGHAMMGWSLGPATGKLVSEIISNKKTSLDIEPFSVERHV